MNLPNQDRLIITGLTVAGLCFMFSDEEDRANFCLNTAVRILLEHDPLLEWRLKWEKLSINYLPTLYPVAS